ncbi:MAG: HAD-IIB family hydrolase [Clostridia bacterium]|nr:HAD-IIB family hydrolase [Clostridia bacterium]
MGKFDGILIASDWDATLHHESGLNNIDIEKIRYFQKEGGRFTVCTGRALSHIRHYFDKIKPNTYVITLNGAVIVDADSGEELYRGHLHKNLVEALDILYLNNELFYTLHVYFDGDESAREYTKEQYRASREKFEKEPIHKILLIADKESKIKEAKMLLGEYHFPKYMFVSSWPLSLEILARENGKGYALCRVGEAIGARLTVGVGDFDNDEQMIRMADIGYAVGNATDELKAIADRITVDVHDGAIAHIIDEIEADVLK